MTSSGTTVTPTSVVCLGDVMLDVVVDAPAGLVPDDDTPATIRFTGGGQAPNVACWVVARGGSAVVLGPRCESGHGPFVTSLLRDRGVAVRGPLVGRAGAVMSLVQTATRSMASDPGDTGWLTRLDPRDLPDRADWLFVSGYALLRAPDPGVLRRLVGEARDRGARVALDLASAAMIDAFGAAGFRRLCESLAPDVVLGNDDEWAALTRGPGAGAAFDPGGRTVLVLKHGARGASFVIDGVADDRPPVPGPVVDPTGAGDALAAGYLVGGVETAMETAARCLATVGAQPRVEQAPSREPA